jgi:hypothetical protein
MTFLARVKRHSISLVLLAGAAATAEDWPQLQHDPQQSGRSLVSVVSGYEAKWVWVDEAHVTRDFVSKKGASIDYPNPRTVITFAGFPRHVAGQTAPRAACLRQRGFDRPASSQIVSGANNLFTTAAMSSLEPRKAHTCAASSQRVRPVPPPIAGM